ncbi:MAG TPA: SipW-dependent-type signal peptide-containing protein [Firmicutes bacterium]|nr:SipW-dependent-type signal peptide-containing protein [Bacillota bacterium]
MNAKKKILSVGLAASLAAVAVVGSSLAYFTDTDAKDNVFTIGNVGIVLTEPKWDEGGAEEALDMYPGEAVAKDPTVTNDGKNPAFVRVKVEFPAGINMTYEAENSYEANTCNEGWVYNEDDGYFYYTKVLEAGASTPAVFSRVRLGTDATNNTEGAESTIKVTAEAVQAQGAKPSFAAVQNMTVEEIAAWFGTCMA